MSVGPRVALLWMMLAPVATAADAPAAERRPVAVLAADWFHNSHPDVLFTRLFDTYTRDGKGPASQLRIASVYRDLPTAKDLSEKYAAQAGFKVVPTAEAALTLGTGKLAVDGVLLSTEWAPYPVSDTGQIVYPHRRLFVDCVKVFEASGRVAPVFVDKHLADAWADSKWIYDTAREMKIPLMAGSTVPLRLLDGGPTVTRGEPVKEIVGISYHTLTTYGFHGLEVVQALAERRKGGETGVVRVRCVTGDAVWDGAGTLYDAELFARALADARPRIPKGKTLRTAVKEPVLFVIEHADGLRVNLFTLNGAALGWSAAWRYADRRSGGRLFSHEHVAGQNRFDWQMKGVEDMILTGKPSWPVERTLLTSGVLDAALISKRDGGRVVETPYLNVRYEADDSWRVPEAMRTERLVK